MTLIVLCELSTIKCVNTLVSFRSTTREAQSPGLLVPFASLLIPGSPLEALRVAHFTLSTFVTYLHFATPSFSKFRVSSSDGLVL